MKDAIADITSKPVLTRAKELDVIATLNLNGASSELRVFDGCVEFAFRLRDRPAQAAPRGGVRVDGERSDDAIVVTVCVRRTVERYDSPVAETTRVPEGDSRPIALPSTRRAIRVAVSLEAFRHANDRRLCSGCSCQLVP